MNEQELIKKLQDQTYVRAFGLMTPAEQECLKSVGKENCLYYSVSGWHETAPNLFINISTYAINPDYQPEPEHVDLEIKESIGGKWLGVFDVNCPPSRKHGTLLHNFTRLKDLPSLPNFDCFWDETDRGGEICISKVARRISKGNQIFARFRK